MIYIIIIIIKLVLSLLLLVVVVVVAVVLWLLPDGHVKESGRGYNIAWFRVQQEFDQVESHVEETILDLHSIAVWPTGFTFDQVVVIYKTASVWVQDGLDRTGRRLKQTDNMLWSQFVTVDNELMINYIIHQLLANAHYLIMLAEAEAGGVASTGMFEGKARGWGGNRIYYIVVLWCAMLLLLYMLLLSCCVIGGCSIYAVGVIV